MSSTSERLPRLLALVPYLVSRPGIRMTEVAADFGVNTQQIRRDLELLWMCGLPGYGPGDLIDLSFSGDTVTVVYDAGMRKPLRLTGQEATSLQVALRALSETPGIADTDAVRRALAKVENAVGAARPHGVVLGLTDESRTVTTEVGSTVEEATRRSRAVHIRYYTASRDEITERTVDPMRLVLVQGNSYLEAWCRRAGGVRLFRLDRIDGAEVLDEPAHPPAEAVSTDLSAGPFRPASQRPSVELELRPEARWVAEYYPVDEVTDLPDGATRVVLRYSDRAWLVRLVLGLGGGGRILAPEELATEVRQRADEALERSLHLPST
ncbi:WYL domain-containing protein [Actinopolyspora erythraea]|uniref:Protein pafC n=1 Tax=Actinopolyspora erythraea TaxID=414996 RepID=A0A099D5Z2_9ACTN|nr:WYL domain-containing protein [Actinopolyspora erythraea]ASU79234.1 WYL domain-containing protein [Actinopolyspora erythraea]KGI80790.1 protein pafC [Actinopolyspora erythraea]